MKVIAIAAEKGGTGKTSTATITADILTQKGYKVLLIDLDPQVNASLITRTESAKKTVLGVLTGESTILEAKQKTPFCDVVPASRALSAADMTFTATGKEAILREALEPVRDVYDYVILDTPPALGVLTINAFVAADDIVVCAETTLLSLQAIEQISTTTDPIKKYFNPKLNVKGILFTRYNPRAIASREMKKYIDTVSERIGTKVFKSTIRTGTALQEAQILRIPLTQHAPKAKVTEDYKRFVDELINEGK